MFSGFIIRTATNPVPLALEQEVGTTSRISSAVGLIVNSTLLTCSKIRPFLAKSVSLSASCEYISL